MQNLWLHFVKIKSHSAPSFYVLWLEASWEYQIIKILMWWSRRTATNWIEKETKRALNYILSEIKSRGREERMKERDEANRKQWEIEFFRDPFCCWLAVSTSHSFPIPTQQRINLMNPRGGFIIIIVDKIDFDSSSFSNLAVNKNKKKINIQFFRLGPDWWISKSNDQWWTTDGKNARAKEGMVGRNEGIRSGEELNRFHSLRLCGRYRNQWECIGRDSSGDLINVLQLNATRFTFFSYISDW